MQDILPEENRAIRTGTTVAVLVVALIAAIVSFVHIASLALTHGQTDLAAYLLPISSDGTVAASSLVMLRAARLDLDTPALARVMLGLSVIATLAANIAYGARYGVTGALLSGRPAVAFVGSAEMAISMVRRARKVAPDEPQTVIEGPPAYEESTVVPAPQDALQPVPGALQPDVPAQVARKAPRAVAGRSRRNTSQRSGKSAQERAEERFGELVLSGSPVPSVRQLKNELGMGTATAQQAKEHLASLSTSNGHAPAE